MLPSKADISNAVLHVTHYLILKEKGLIKDGDEYNRYVAKASSIVDQTVAKFREEENEL